jgi:hypothetical protein
MTASDKVPPDANIDSWPTQFFGPPDSLACRHFPPNPFPSNARRAISSKCLKSQQLQSQGLAELRLPQNAFGQMRIGVQKLLVRLNTG